jgi:hypothetical protein
VESCGETEGYDAHGREGMDVYTGWDETESGDGGVDLKYALGLAFREHGVLALHTFVGCDVAFTLWCN